MFTLKAFLILVIVLMVVLLLTSVFFQRGEDRAINKAWPYFLLLSIVVVLSFGTFLRYTKSDGKDNYYKNTDYHLFRQEGFMYPEGHRAMLADNNVDNAILLSGIGELWLDDSVRLNTEDFGLPLYVGALKKDKEIEMSVANLINEYGMDSGDSLLIRKGNEPLLSIKYVEFPRKRSNSSEYDSVMFVFSVNGMQNDTIVKQSFYKGYNLADLLQEGNTTRLDAASYSFLGKCYLVRDHYTLDASKRKKTSEKVYFFADNPGFNDSCQVIMNGNVLASTPQNEARAIPMENKYFSFGLGNAKTPVYQVKREGKNVFVKYRLPIMYHFPGEDNLGKGEAKLFLTTSKQDIIELRDDYRLFYQFNEQLSDNSIYKASAVLNFRIDDAGVKLNPEIADGFDEENLGASVKVEPGKPFEVKTMSCSGAYHGNLAQVSYVFSIVDMRKNEVYSGTLWLYLLMMALLAVVYWLLNGVSGERMGKWYGIETSVYLVLVAFLTVRLILLWRLHAFPPIEGVSFNEFHRLTDSSVFTFTGIAIWGMLLLRIVVLLVQRNQQEYKWKRLGAITEKYRFNQVVENAFDKLDGSLKWRVLVMVVLPPVIYAFCGLLLGLFGKMEMVVKEALAPVMVFAINSIYFVYKARCEEQAVNNEDVKLARRFCWWGMTINSLWFLVFLLIPKKLLIGFGEQGMFAPMAAVLALWFFVAILLTEDRKWRKFLYPAGFLVVLFVVFLHAVVVERTDAGKWMLSKLPFSRIKARMETLVYTPTEMVQNEMVEFEGKSLQDILNASSNKWFIDNHLVERRRLDNPPDLYLDKEYNQMAVTYVTQTRDVLLARYVIYEHGKSIVRLLLIMLMVLSVNVLLLYKRKDTELPFLQMVPIQSAYYLLVFSGFLFLVNLNAVVFVGLDFPFLTMSSKVAPLGLLIPLLSLLLPLHPEYIDDTIEDVSADGKTAKYIIGGIATALLIVFMVVPGRWANKQIEAREQNNELQAETFSVSMEPLADFINNYLNPAFKEWQDEGKKIVARQNKANRRLKKVALKDLTINSPVLKTELDSVVMKDPTHFDAQLKLFAKNINDPAHVNDTVFIRSAFNKFFKTSLTNTRSIVHIKKRKGYFVFVPNKLYYDMKPMFNHGQKKYWNGDLLAAKGASRIQFVEESDNNKTYWAIDRSVDNLKLFSREPQYSRFLTDENRFVGELYQIPAKYCYDTTNDVFVATASMTKDNVIKVYPKRDKSDCVTESIGLMVLPNDIVEINGERSFSLRQENEHYFSKRIHYNGKYQPIYPMGNQFMFAYNFDRMLADCYHPSDSANQPVRISLDYDLLISVNQYLRDVMRRSRGYGDGVAVTAVDGNGRIRLLADYNPNKPLTTDPNQEKELEKKMEEIYLSGDEAAEKTLFQNRNIAFMNVGPGSTIKVPFYVAIMTQTPNIEWDTLRISFTNGRDPDGNKLYESVPNPITGKNRDKVTYFGKDKVSGFHKLNGWDELPGEYYNPLHTLGGMLGPSDFIATSNNFYFGSVLMLGAYDANLLDQGLGRVLDVTNQTEVVFPKFVIGNTYYTFKKDLMTDVQNSSLALRNFALEAGLQDVFRFNLGKRKNNQLLPYYDREPVQSLFGVSDESEWATMNALYVHSTKPAVYREILEQTSQEDFYNNNFQLTAGGALQLEVTPLNMAEMYLRLALQNGSDNKSLLTYCDTSSSVPLASVFPFPVQTMQRTAFKGMYKVINQTKSGANGTLHASYHVGNGLRNELNQKGIYLYGKTGTAGISGRVNNNYHYAFVLTNKPLHLNNADREDLKVYVVYFGYYNNRLGHSGTCNSRDEILHQIINSETFKAYWESTENN